MKFLRSLYNALKRVADIWVVLLLIACAATMVAALGWYFELVTHFMVYYFFAAAVVAGFNLLCGRWIPLLISLTLLVFTGLHLRPFYYPKAEPVVESGTIYKVLSLNLSLDNPNAHAVIDFLEAEAPDILLLQEVTDRWVENLDSIAANYPHQVLQSRADPFGIWLLSKKPFIEKSVHPDENARSPYIKAVIDLDGTPMHFVGVHPHPPLGASAAEARNKTLSGAGELLRKVTESKMLIGDLNTTAWSPVFKRLKTNSALVDSAIGRAIVPTYHASVPFVRLPIDHCLVSESMRIIDRQVGPNVGSDHLGLILRFSLN